MFTTNIIYIFIKYFVFQTISVASILTPVPLIIPLSKHCLTIYVIISSNVDFSRHWVIDFDNKLLSGNSSSGLMPGKYIFDSFKLASSIIFSSDNMYKCWKKKQFTHHFWFFCRSSKVLAIAIFKQFIDKTKIWYRI